MENKDNINHPDHYTGHPSGIECIEVAQYMGFCLGNAIKYIWRDGQKAGEDVNDDLRKAIWYIQREIDRRIDEMELENECNIESGFVVRAEKPAEVSETDAVPLVTKSVSSPDAISQTDTIPVKTPRFLDYADAQEQVAIGNDYYRGTNNRKQDYEVAVEWWTLAAAQGNAEAHWLLGNAYLFGRGVKKNKEEAHRLWKLSQQNRFGKDAQ